MFSHVTAVKHGVYRKFADSDVQARQLSDHMRGQRTQRCHTVPHRSRDPPDSPPECCRICPRDHARGPHRHCPLPAPRTEALRRCPSVHGPAPPGSPRGSGIAWAHPVPPTETTRSTPPITAVFRALRDLHVVSGDHHDTVDHEPRLVEQFGDQGRCDPRRPPGPCDRPPRPPVRDRPNPRAVPWMPPYMRACPRGDSPIPGLPVR